MIVVINLIYNAFVQVSLVQKLRVFGQFPDFLDRVMLYTEINQLPLLNSNYLITERLAVSKYSYLFSETLMSVGVKSWRVIILLWAMRTLAERQ